MLVNREVTAYRIKIWPADNQPPVITRTFSVHVYKDDGITKAAAMQYAQEVMENNHIWIGNVLTRIDRIELIEELKLS